MLKQTSAKFYYFVTNDEGKDVLRSRTVSNVDILANDTQINALAAAFEALTEDVYAIVEKVQTHVIR
ncbi:DUF1659 domain-containing protein [Corticicoccus populi]|uniref:DUF1659 domain-containing protein n=1 Tax=Corticicoccus populi TaxID=1812821 RepID=A0ABW5X0P0_9STAP